MQVAPALIHKAQAAIFFIVLVMEVIACPVPFGFRFALGSLAHQTRHRHIPPQPSPTGSPQSDAGSRSAAQHLKRLPLSLVRVALLAATAGWERPAQGRSARRMNGAPMQRPSARAAPAVNRDVWTRGKAPAIASALRLVRMGTPEILAKLAGSAYASSASSYQKYSNQEKTGGPRAGNGAAVRAAMCAAGTGRNACTNG